MDLAISNTTSASGSSASDNMISLYVHVHWQDLYEFDAFTFQIHHRSYNHDLFVY